MTYVDFEHLSFESIENKIQGIVPLYTSSTVNIPLLAAYAGLSSQTTSAGIDAILSEMNQKLNWQQKLQFAQVFGDYALVHADAVREGEPNPAGSISLNKEYPGAIPPDAIIENLKTQNSLGVCRDIALAQTKVMTGLGIRAYAMTLTIPEGNHAITMVKDPLKSGQLDFFDFGELEKKSMNGAIQSLTLSKDISITYHFYNSHGREVSALPSEIEAMIQEGAGGDIKNLDPFLWRPEGSMVNAGIDIHALHVAALRGALKSRAKKK